MPFDRLVAKTLAASFQTILFWDQIHLPVVIPKPQPAFRRMRGVNVFLLSLSVHRGRWGGGLLHTGCPPPTYSGAPHSGLISSPTVQREPYSGAPHRGLISSPTVQREPYSRAPHRDTPPPAYRRHHTVELHTAPPPPNCSSGSRIDTLWSVRLLRVWAKESKYKVIVSSNFDCFAPVSCSSLDASLIIVTNVL